MTACLGLLPLLVLFLLVDVVCRFSFLPLMLVGVVLVDAECWVSVVFR
ncbi:hypothetical protein [Gardnerella vaginalis]|nr:hypothetical protein [Gardnerella vaginalis]